MFIHVGDGMFRFMIVLSFRQDEDILVGQPLIEVAYRATGSLGDESVIILGSSGQGVDARPPQGATSL